MKGQGSYTFKWDVNVSANFNWNQGATRTLSINRPGAVPRGTTGNLTYNTLTQATVDSFQFDPAKLLDISAQKIVKFRGGKERLKLSVDAFNVFNANQIQTYVSGNQSTAGFTQPASIVPPRGVPLRRVDPVLKQARGRPRCCLHFVTSATGPGLRPGTGFRCTTVFSLMGRRRGKDYSERTVTLANSESWWPFVLFLGGVFVLKAIVLAQLQHHPLLEPEGGVDSAAYVGLARRVVVG